MSSLADKMSMLVDEYNHSKNSPSYRKLNTKYKALKATNAELIKLLTTLFSELNTNRNVSMEEPKYKQKSAKHKLRRSHASAAAEKFINQHDSECSDVEDEEPIESENNHKKPSSRKVSCESSKTREPSYENRANDYYVEIDVKVEPSLSDEVAEVVQVTNKKECNTISIDVEILPGEQNIAGDITAIGHNVVNGLSEDNQNSVSLQNTENDGEEMEEVEEETENEETVEVEGIEVVEESEETEEVEVDVEEVEGIEVVEEIEVEEEVEVEEETEEVEVEEEVEEVEVEEEESDETGVYEIEVNGTRYYTTSEKDGIVYALIDDDDVGDEIGKFVNGKLILNA
jgi:hypothetical protein